MSQSALPAPLTPHTAASGSQRAQSQALHFETETEAFACSLSWGFSLFTFPVMCCCVHVTRPTRVWFPLPMLCTTAPFGNKHQASSGFGGDIRRRFQVVPQPTEQLRASHCLAPWHKQGQNVLSFTLLLPGREFPFPPTHLSLSQPLLTFRANYFSGFPRSCLLPHTQCLPGLAWPFCCFQRKRSQWICQT